MKIPFTYQDGDRVGDGHFEVPKSSRYDFQSCFVFAFPKSGSVLVNAIVQSVMSEWGVPVVDFSSQLYDQGVDIETVQCDLRCLFTEKGYCYSGFRELPRSMLGSASIRSACKILIVRDPRDMLVSRYYSTKFSHGFAERGSPQFSRLMAELIKDSNMDIDEYCLHYSWMINSQLLSHAAVISDPKTLVLKYEEFLYDKRLLARQLCEWFSVGLSSDRIEAIAAAHDFIPEEERQDQHIRQAHPGDYQRKLKPETISALNVVLRRFFRKFGYDA
jgi:sulfotransferase family protein